MSYLRTAFCRSPGRLFDCLRLPQRRHAVSRGAQALQEWTPLCERPAESVVPVPSFVQWRTKTVAQLEHNAVAYDIPLSELKAIQKEGDPNPSPLDLTARGVMEIELPNGGDVLMRMDLEELDALWKRRLHDRVPIQYLTHTVHWRDVVLAVGPGVLIPRPETEELIDLAEDAIKQNPALLDLPWVDLGTGSGAIAICLAQLLKRYKGKGTVVATDISPLCLQCTRLNIKRLNLEASGIDVVQGEWFEPLKEWRGRLGGIISNPPYIPTGDLATLQPEVGLHEPHLALDGGPDGMTPLEIIVPKALDYLASGGVLLLETGGMNQAFNVSDRYVQEQQQPQEQCPSAIPFFHTMYVQRDVSRLEQFLFLMKC